MVRHGSPEAPPAVVLNMLLTSHRSSECLFEYTLSSGIVFDGSVGAAVNAAVWAATRARAHQFCVAEALPCPGRSVADGYCSTGQVGPSYLRMASLPPACFMAWWPRVDRQGRRQRRDQVGRATQRWRRPENLSEISLSVATRLLPPWPSRLGPCQTTLCPPTSPPLHNSHGEEHAHELPAHHGASVARLWQCGTWSPTTSNILRHVPHPLPTCPTSSPRIY